MKKGLSASRFADDNEADKKEDNEGATDSEAPAAAGEEPDHSSAAMSAVRSTPYTNPRLPVAASSLASTFTYPSFFQAIMRKSG